MLNKFLKIVASLMVVSSLTTCNNYEFPKSPYPKIETLPVVNISEMGVTFQGNITQLADKKIVNHGFVWGRLEGVSINSEDQVQLGAATRLGIFENEVKSGLVANKIYFVKAFVATEDYVVYGTAVRFTSMGSTPPVIDSFSPTQGRWGDTVTIKGKYFRGSYSGAIPVRDSLQFGSYKARVLMSNDSIITCIVPDNIPDKTTFIFLTVNGRRSQSTTNFVLEFPAIESFTPKQGTWGDTITVKGKYFSGRYFDEVPARNFLQFGTSKAGVLTRNDSVLTCIVPNNIPYKTTPIFLTVNGMRGQSTTDFVFVSPTIENFAPKLATFDDTITIVGKNFSKTEQTNVVKFDNAFAKVIESSSSQLKVKVPPGIRKKESIISVTVNLQSAYSGDPFVIAPPFISSISTTKIRTGMTVQINGGNFDPFGSEVLLDGLPAIVLSSAKSSITIELPQGIYKNRSFPIEVIVCEQSAFSQEMITLNNPWFRRADIPNSEFGKHDVVAFSLNGRGYVGLGGECAGVAEVGNKFWRYDPEDNSWTEVAPYPGGARIGAISFVIGDKAYVGLGEQKDFWTYSHQSNSWSRVADFPVEGAQAEAVGYSVNGKGYVLTRGEVATDFWEYDPILNSWVSLQSIPTSGEANYLRPDAGFVIDESLFVYLAHHFGAGEFWEFDFNAGQWIQRAEPFFEGPTSGFSVGSYGYLTGNFRLVKYDPSLDSWLNIDNEELVEQNHLSINFVIGSKAYLGAGPSSLGCVNEFWEYDPNYE